MARTMRSGGRSNASSRVRKPARRRPSSSACTWSDSRSRRGLESKSSTPCGRRGGRHDAARGVQPSRGPAAAELALGVAALALVGQLDGGQEHLLHGALHRAHGEALLEHAVGHALVEVVEGVEQPRGGRGALAALAGELDGRRDVVGLEQRPAQRLELGEVVLAMAALRPARLGVAEAALPAPERVGAHPEQLGGGVGPDPAHMTSKSTDRVSVAALLPTSPPRFRGVETLCTGL